MTMPEKTTSPERVLRYADRKGRICEELGRCATLKRTISYGDLGHAVGMPARGPWKDVLGEISQEKEAACSATIVMSGARQLG
jgi:hypothetical protein